MRLTGSLGFPWNSDSHVFVGVAARPDAIFDMGGAGALWQSRPLFVAFGALARAWWKTALDAAGLHPRLEDEDVPGWLGFVVLNFLVLAIALALFAGLFEDLPRAPVALAAFVSMLAWNRVVKVFFWNAHTQMFNVLVPILAISWCTSALEGSASLARRSARMLMAGLMTLAYGSFVLAAAAGAAGEAVRRARQGTPVRRIAARLAACGALFALPPLAWFGGVRLAIGRVYLREAARYHEFVWIRESLRDHRFAKAALENAAKFLASVPAEIVVALTVLLVLASVVRAGGTSLRDRPATARLIEASLIVLLLAGAFFGSMGYYAVRLSWNLFPPLLVLILALAGETIRSGAISRGAVSAAALAVAAASALFWVFHPGPWC